MSDRAHMTQAPTSTLNALLALRELLSEERRWTKHLMVRSTAENGRAYCLLGGVNHVTWGGRHYYDCLEALWAELPAWAHEALDLYNDNATTKHKDVLALIDRAILRQQA
jgi:hypothetical protein